LGVADIVKRGSDVTVVGWGAQMRVLEEACNLAEEIGISCELIDLQTISPWDVDTIEQSVRKTGRLVVSHEAPVSKKNMFFCVMLFREFSDQLSLY
jgi:2-oxoisovalerate dehydrogenase E1 component beta subunit